MSFERVLSLLHHTTNHLLILGEGGSGKTFLINQIIQEFKDRDESHALVCCAPTGRAAHLIGGFTLHRYFGFAPRIQLPEHEDPLAQQSSYAHLTTLIIDEVSMVRADLLDAVERRLRAGGPKPGQPFGGVRLILVGDVLQLPPIVENEEQPYFTGQTKPSTWPSTWFFSAKSYPQDIYRVTLQGNYRAREDVPFQEALAAARVGKISPQQLALLNTRKGRRAASKSLVICPLKRLVEEYNAVRFAELSRLRAYYYEATSEGWTDDEEMTPAPWNITLKKGTRVVLLANTSGLFNGATGLVVTCSQDKVRIRPDKIGSPEVDICRFTWKRRRYSWNEQSQHTEISAEETFTQMPLMQGWAFTIHRMQGQTLDDSYLLDMPYTFAKGMGYVAISRARKLEHLHLRYSVFASDFIPDQQALDFHLKPDTTDDELACDHFVRDPHRSANEEFQILSSGRKRP
jgi:ATP-dependent exoDNAse (exonuclease V) alpha subunit